MLRYGVPLLWLLLLTGCQSIPLGLNQEAPNKEEVVATEDAAGELVVVPSPYEQNQGSVSSDAKARYGKALVAMQVGDWKDAEQRLLALVSDYPALSGPVLNLGIVSEQQADNKKAEAYYQQTIAVNANNLAAYHRLAVLLREQGRFQEAEAVYLRALTVWDQDAVSHKNLGILYDLYMGRLDDALIHYESYLALTEPPDRQVKGWVADLSRRIKAEQ